MLGEEPGPLWAGRRRAGYSKCSVTITSTSAVWSWGEELEGAPADWVGGGMGGQGGKLCWGQYGAEYMEAHKYWGPPDKIQGCSSPALLTADGSVPCGVPGGPLPLAGVDGPASKCAMGEQGQEE